MKITTILGSPRKNGNTAKVLEWVEEELRSLGHEVDRIDLIDLQIAGCRECYECRECLDEAGCAQIDDADEVFLRMIASDAIVLASPLFSWDFAAQMKALIERFFCLVSGYGGDGWKSQVQGRRFGLVVTAAGPVEGNMDLIQEVFRRTVNWIRGVNAAQLLVPWCSTPEELKPEIRDQAKTFANLLVGRE